MTQPQAANKSPLILDRYETDCQKPEVKAFMAFLRYGRKVGFPVVCTLGGLSEEKQLHYAASVLLTIADTIELEHIQTDRVMELPVESTLYKDALEFVQIANGRMQELKSLNLK